MAQRPKLAFPRAKLMAQRPKLAFPRAKLMAQRPKLAFPRAKLMAQRPKLALPRAKLTIRTAKLVLRKARFTPGGVSLVFAIPIVPSQLRKPTTHGVSLAIGRVRSATRQPSAANPRTRLATSRPKPAPRQTKFSVRRPIGCRRQEKLSRRARSHARGRVNAACGGTSDTPRRGRLARGPPRFTRDETTYDGPSPRAGPRRARTREPAPRQLKRARTSPRAW